MFKIVLLQGGLGNQMFAYAFYLALKHRFKFSFVMIEPISCFTSHNGYELPDIFPNVKPKRPYKLYRRVQKTYSEYFFKGLFKRVVEKELGDFNPDFAKNRFPFIVFDGYWQTERYFEKLKRIIRETFQFDENKLNEKTAQLRELLEKENSVSIHIRRGDYNKHDELNGICTLEYYKNALTYINKHANDLKYYIFTDDKEWVNASFSFLQFKLIDWNKTTESWQDMYLMTKCKHNIIANSSFSWWGAWLNQNKEKIVIAPSKWFQTLIAQNIIPEDWIKI